MVVWTGAAFIEACGLTKPKNKQNTKITNTYLFDIEFEHFVTVLLPKRRLFCLIIFKYVL